MKAQIRILLADDHVSLREGLATLLNMEPELEVVAQASTGRKAVEQYRIHHPDVVLMDLEMPDGNGPEAISIIRSFDASAKVIVLTTYIGEDDVCRAMDAGAKAYLLKDAETDVLLNCIRKVASGGRHLSTEVMETLSNRRPEERLSDRELQVLRNLAQGLLITEIAALLKISESTVKFHVSNIYSKLHVSDRAQAIVVAMRKGLLHLTSL